MANKVEFNRDVYDDLAEFIYKRTRWAWLEDPYWCHEVIEGIIWWEGLWWTNVESLYLLIKDVLKHLWKDSFLIDSWYKHNNIHAAKGETLYEYRNYLFKTLIWILEDQGIDEDYWTKILYNCSS